MNYSKIVLHFFLIVIALSACDTEPDYAAYDTWDADRDEIIEEDEFQTTYRETDYFEAWDVDGDSVVEVAEWETGVNNYYPVYDYETNGDFDDWDVNQDNELDEDEFVTGTYRLWDTDNDGKIEAVEYQEWYHDT